jgi:hypothetical protein
MQLFWRDVFDRGDPTIWRGLRVRAQGQNQPGFLVTASHPGFVRIAVGDVPLLWARIDDDYWGYELLRAPPGNALSVIPPFTAELVLEHYDTNSAPSAAWARTYSRMLGETPATPLYDGDWHVGALNMGFDAFELAPSVVCKVVNQRTNGYVQWDFGDVVYPITLRDMSSPDAGRVKAWRKHVREGTLPPILLQSVSGLDAYVVLDGHDRLLAASLEHAAAPALALEPVEEIVASEEQQRAVMAAVEKSLEAAKRESARSHDERLARARRLFTTEHANQLLVDAFSPRQRSVRTRARPLPGGVDRWASEVRGALILRGMENSNLLRAL